MDSDSEDDYVGSNAMTAEADAMMKRLREQAKKEFEAMSPASKSRVADSFREWVK